MSGLDFTPPDEIDGDPAEVRREAVAQLERLALGLQRVTRKTAAQVRNAGRQDALEHGATGDLDIAYEIRRGKEAGLLRIVDDRVDEALRAISNLRRAGEEYDADPDADLALNR